jgi:hypothetical protein
MYSRTELTHTSTWPYFLHVRFRGKPGEKLFSVGARQASSVTPAQGQVSGRRVEVFWPQVLFGGARTHLHAMGGQGYRNKLFENDGRAFELRSNSGLTRTATSWLFVHECQCGCSDSLCKKEVAFSLQKFYQCALC